VFYLLREDDGDLAAEGFGEALQAEISDAQTPAQQSPPAHLQSDDASHLFRRWVCGQAGAASGRRRCHFP